MAVKFVDLTLSLKLRDKIDAAITDVLNEGVFIGGSRLRRFEEDFANYMKCMHCVGCSSGTDALMIIFETLKLCDLCRVDNSVLIQANTFFATVEAAVSANFNPIIADVNEDGQLTLDIVRRMYDARPFSVVCITHMYGRICPDLLDIASWCQANGVHLVEDAAQAVGALFEGQAVVGRCSYAAAVSFYPAKNLGCFGDGGAIIGNKQLDADLVRALVSHGEYKKGYHAHYSGTYRLDTIQAAVLTEKLKYLDQANQQRQRYAKTYLKYFGELGIDWIKVMPIDNSNLHLFAILFESRDLSHVQHRIDRNTLKEYLEKCDIQTGIHYRFPVDKTDAMQDYVDPCGFGTPVAERISNQILTLPMHPNLGDDGARDVTIAIANFGVEHGIKSA